MAGLSVAYLRKRREYFANRDTRNGWSQNESGPCCDKCRMTNPANPLQALVGCRNPFQIASVCECHVPTRKAVTAGILEVFDQLIAAALAKEKPATGEEAYQHGEDCPNDCGCRHTHPNEVDGDQEQ